jgi:hypothetical protein
MSRSVSSALRCLSRLAASLVVLGCVGGAAAAAAPPPNRWESLRALDLRVAGVAYRLSLSNTKFCPYAVAPQAGFVLHSLDQYDLADREGAARHFALDSLVGVVAVVPGSPADRSGLAADDQLVFANGRPLRASIGPGPAAGPTRAAVDFAEHVLAEEMAKGEVILRVSRAGKYLDARFTADPGCASGVEVATSHEINAWADGQRVVVSEGIVARCATDGDLALVIGHELAHNILHHGRGLAAAGSPGRRLRLTGSGTAAMRETEEEADRLGIWMASGAAYDLSDAHSFLTALLDADAFGRDAGTHPAPVRRLRLLRSEIAAAGARGGFGLTLAPAP